MGALTELVQCPSLRIIVFRKIDTVCNVAKKRVRIVATGVNEADFGAGAVPVGGDSMKFHQSLTPTVGTFARKPPRCAFQRTQPNDILLSGIQRRILDIALPVVSRRTHVDRVNNGAIDGVRLQAREPCRIRDRLGGETTTE